MMVGSLVKTAFVLANMHGLARLHFPAQLAWNVVIILIPSWDKSGGVLCGDIPQVVYCFRFKSVLLPFQFRVPQACG